MRCEHCGAEIGPDDAFCPLCGDPVTFAGGHTRNRNTRFFDRLLKGDDGSENNLDLIILAGALSVLIVGVGVIGTIL